MPEISKDASILIAISYQALFRADINNSRIIETDDRTIICDSTVAIVFASFFIEANLNSIIESIGMKQKMIEFLEYEKPGLQDKLAWFYNTYVSQSPKSTKNELKKVYKELALRFPGFDIIYKFRNNISHGVVDKSISNFAVASKLRKQAKRIVEDLFEITALSGFVIPRPISFDDAVV